MLKVELHVALSTGLCMHSLPQSKECSGLGWWDLVGPWQKTGDTTLKLY